MLSAEETRVIEKIQFYRKQAKKTQEELANELNMSRTTLVAIEKGERKLRADELVKITEILGIPLAEISRESRFQTKEKKLQFRKFIHAEASSPAIEYVVEKIFSFCEKYQEIEEKSSNHQFIKATPPPAYNRGGSTVDMAARSIAKRERQRLGLGDAPIPEHFSLLLENESGVSIFKFPVSEYQFCGAYLYDSLLGGCMFINSKHSSERQRFTIAHEYGHYLSDRESLSVDEGEEESSSSKKPDSEKFADLFASYFLLPPDGVVNQFQQICQRHNEFTPMDIVAMSEYYQVSFHAMCIQLERLDCIDSGAYQYLKNKKFKPDEFRKAKVNREESLYSRFPKRFQDMVYCLYKEDELSHGELQELFEEGVIEINEFIAYKEEEDELRKNLLTMK